MLAMVLSFIIISVAIINLLASNNIPFHNWFEWTRAKAAYLPFLPLDIHLLGSVWTVDITDAGFDRALFGIATCLVGSVLMWIYYHTEYQNYQRFNGQHLRAFLLNYNTTLNNGYQQAKVGAANTLNSEGQVDEMKHEIVLWITNMQWFSFRTLFIEMYLRNILFQVHRNSSYYLMLIPMAVALFAVVAAYSMLEIVRALGWYDFGLVSALSHQNTFYPFFFLLALLYYTYLRVSVSFVYDSLRQKGWITFSQMDVHSSLTEIHEAIVNQIDRWRQAQKTTVSPAFFNPPRTDSRERDRKPEVEPA
jgi:hypothetical protein